jgi:hypothetical protein
VSAIELIEQLKALPAHEQADFAQGLASPRR